MKKLLLASTITILSISAAQANVTSKDGPVQLYGKAFLTVDATSTDTETTVNGKKTTDDSKKTRPALNSNSSRIGFKGKEPLVDDISVVYQLEYGIDVAEGTQQFKSRDTYLGLSHAQFGTVTAGRLSTIDGKVDFANVVDGGLADRVWATFEKKRMDNTFAYASPDLNGAQVLAMYSLDEDTTGREYAGIAGKYTPEGQPFKAGASYIHGASAGKGDVKDVFRVSGNYKLNDDITVGALYQLTDFNTDDKENALTVSGQMKMAGDWTAYAQGDMVTNIKGVKDSDKYRVAVGGKYAFNTHTIGHVYGVMSQKEEEKAAATKEKTTTLGIGGGLEYKF